MHDALVDEDGQGLLTRLRTPRGGGLDPGSSSLVGGQTQIEREVAVCSRLRGVEPGDARVTARGRTLPISGERKASEQISDEDYWLRGIAYGRTVPIRVEQPSLAA